MNASELKGMPVLSGDDTTFTGSHLHASGPKPLTVAAPVADDGLADDHGGSHSRGPMPVADTRA